MIATLFSLATSRLTGPIALAVCAVLSLFLIGARMEVGGLRLENSEYHRAIHDPKTGWKVRLDDCRDNVKSLDVALTLQNEAVEALKASGDQMARNAEKAAVEARKAQRTADQYAAKLAGFQAGKTCEEREGNVQDLIGSLTQ